MPPVHRNRAPRLVSYEGVVTSVVPSAYVELDGNARTRVWVCHLPGGRIGCRIGARVVAHNLHPLLVRGKLVGLGACMNTRVRRRFVHDSPVCPCRGLIFCAPDAMPMLTDPDCGASRLRRRFNPPGTAADGAGAHVQSASPSGPVGNALRGLAIHQVPWLCAARCHHWCGQQIVQSEARSVRARALPSVAAATCAARFRPAV